MRVPRIVKVVAVLALLWGAWQFLGWKKSDTSPLTGFSIVGVEASKEEVVIFVRSSSYVDPSSISVKTSGECSYVSQELVEEENVARIVYRCPEGDFVRVSGGGVTIVKRVG